MANQTYVPLKEAAEQQNIDEKVLTQLISAGMIEAKKEAGEIMVVVDKNGNGEPQTKEEIIAAKFAHLKGRPISAYGAQKKYGIHHNSFIRWARSGYIKILDETGRSIELDEVDVAYCAYVYELKKEKYNGRIAGVKIFDEKGNPYQVKYPGLSALRRT